MQSASCTSALRLGLLVCVAAARAEEANPYSENGDATQECFAWAADGQCKLNAGHMLSQCKYSCWEWFAHRKKTYPDAPIDKHMDCHGWSNQGECGTNPTFMKANCPESCSEKGYDPPPEDPSSSKQKRRRRKKKRRTTGKDEL